MSVGYSGTPLAKKLGIGNGCRVLAINEPANYIELLRPLPENVEFAEQGTAGGEVVHLFTNNADVLRRLLAQVISLIKQI